MTSSNGIVALLILLVYVSHDRMSVSFEKIDALCQRFDLPRPGCRRK